MRYSKFHIKNFKGIKDAVLDLGDGSKLSILPIVGLNESGKTTILEAIHTFSPDYRTGNLLGRNGSLGVPIESRVPRHLISTLTGFISVSATIIASGKEIDDVLSVIKNDEKIKVDRDRIPDQITLTKKDRFANGNYIESIEIAEGTWYVKTGSERRWREAGSKELNSIYKRFWSLTPYIAFFPDLVFDFPISINITNTKKGPVNSFYTSVFEDILSYDNRGYTIENSIKSRVRAPELILPWFDFFTAWRQRNDQEKIQQVMDRASAVLTNVVLKKWNEIFGEETTGREIVVTFEIVGGEIRDKAGNAQASNEHDVCIKFELKDNTNRFPIKNRSLGFRWFFTFLLFTQFRSAKDLDLPVLYLFDEPASNLHATAQQKLLDSFPNIARGQNVLAYTTHSHYLIEPKWLEQTFIVTNSADDPNQSVIAAASMEDESLDIRPTKYKQFVNDHPNTTDYFRPILDRLQVIPSTFDLNRASIILEGKSDYFIIRYGMALLGKENQLALVPGLGAGTLGALISLHLGWGLKLIFLLDSDKAGRKEKERYEDEYGLTAKTICLLSEIVPGCDEIEDILDGDAINVIRSELSLTKRPTKKEILRFFQEQLASDSKVKLGTGFETSMEKLLPELKARLAAP